MTTLIQPSVKTSALTTRPELDLLLCCARTRVDAETAEHIKTLVQENIEWRYLVQTSLRHGVMSLLYQNLNAICSESVPKPILVELRNHFQVNALHNLFLSQELLKLLNLFEEYDIPAIPFKGAVLTASAYGNLALRTFCDLDILVHKQDFLRAKDLLIRQGYHHLYFGEHETAYAQAQLLRDDGQVGVDLHYGMTPRVFFFSLDSEPFWHRLSPISLAGTTVNCFSPEDSLLIAFVHGYKEGWSSLKRICDMAELIRAYPRLDWERILARFDALGVERSFSVILLFANNYLGTPLPEAVSKRIKALPSLRLLTVQLREQLFSENEQTLRFGERTLFRLATMDNLQDRLQYCLRVALNLNEEDRALMPLPTFLSFLYYPLRVFRLVITSKLDLGRLLKSLLR